MRQRSFAMYLEDLKSASDEILQFTAGKDRAAYESNIMTQRAVERSFGIIGEAMAQIRQYHPSMLEHFHEARAVIDFRNFIVHEYNVVDNDEVWSAVKSKLPAFREQIISLIAREEAGEFS